MEKLVCLLLLAVAATNGQTWSPIATNGTTGGGGIDVGEIIMNITTGMNGTFGNMTGGMNGTFGNMTGGMNGTTPPMFRMACFQGSTIYKDGQVVFNNRTSRECLGAGPFSCVLYNTLDENGYYSQTGVCAPTEYVEGYTCEQASAFAGINFTSCNVTACEGHTCNNFKEPPQCPQVTTQVVDVKILPGCTMRNVINDMGGCLFNHMMQYPFQEQQMCRQSLAETFSCARKVALGCLGSPCHTPLDFIPEMLYFFQIGDYYLKEKIETLQDLMNLVGNPVIEGMVYSYACPVPGEVPYLPSAEDMSIGKQEIMVCDNYFLRDLVDAGLGFARQFYMARTQQELCVDFTAFMKKVEGMVAGRCDFSMVGGMVDQIAVLLGEPYDRLVPVIHNAITVLSDMMSNLQMPECGAPAPMDLRCERFYNSPRGCDQRKAWMCSLIDWRLNAVHSNLMGLFAWAEANGVEHGIEPQQCFEYPENFCAHKDQMHCVMDPSPCKYCFCGDMEFTNPGFMMTVYKRDFYSWKHIMYRYKMLLQNYNSCSPMQSPMQ